MKDRRQMGLFDEQPPPKKEPLPKDPPAMSFLRKGRWFASKRRSTCDSCGERISFGDRIWLVPYRSAICEMCKVIHLPGE